jgi:hypothetical protein
MYRNSHEEGSQLGNDLSSSMSQVSYEEGFPNAEYNAMAEEEKARRKKEEKDRKLKEFQKHTKENANKKLKEE